MHAYLSSYHNYSEYNHWQLHVVCPIINILTFDKKKYKKPNIIFRKCNLKTSNSRGACGSLLISGEIILNNHFNFANCIVAIFGSLKSYHGVFTVLLTVNKKLQLPLCIIKEILKKTVHKDYKSIVVQ